MVMTVEPSAFAAQEMRSREWARTTPGWLRVVSVTLAGLMVATGAFAVLAMLARQRATGAARNTAEPLLVDAQQIDVELSDANTTIAGGFLAGPVLPAADRARFQGDMAAAAAALAAAGQRAGTDPGVSQLLQTLSTGLPTYTGIVATSEVNNQEQFPVAAAYLAEANNLAGATLLPAASALYNTERARLVNDDSKATGLPLLLVVFVLLGITLIASGLAANFPQPALQAVSQPPGPAGYWAGGRGDGLVGGGRRGRGWGGPPRRAPRDQSPHRPHASPDLRPTGSRRRRAHAGDTRRSGELPEGLPGRGDGGHLTGRYGPARVDRDRGPIRVDGGGPLAGLPDRTRSDTRPGQLGRSAGRHRRGPVCRRRPRLARRTRRLVRR